MKTKLKPSDAVYIWTTDRIGVIQHCDEKEINDCGLYKVYTDSAYHNGIECMSSFQLYKIGRE